MAEQRPALETY